VAVFGRRQGGRGRRSAYAAKPDRVGFRRYMPITLVYWFGAVLFTFCAVAVGAYVVDAVVNDIGNDWIAAGFVLLLLLYVVYLFGTTRVRE
jgi:hypothetical protein